MREEVWGGLKVRILGGEDRHGGGSGPVVVLLHGFGAPGTDLIGLLRVMDVPRDWRFVFPEAPIELGPMYGAGRAWWNLDMAALEHAMSSGKPRDLRDVEPEGLHTAADALLGMLTEARTHLGGSDWVVGGFSQGAMLSCDVALRSDMPLTGLVLLSAGYVDAARWKSLMPTREGLGVFQSHGRSDTLLAFDAAQALRDDLAAAGLELTFTEFAGGHEIPATVLEGLGTFLRGVLPD